MTDKVIANQFIMWIQVYLTWVFLKKINKRLNLKKSCKQLTNNSVWTGPFLCTKKERTVCVCVLGGEGRGGGSVSSTDKVSDSWIKRNLGFNLCLH